jgi:topoisomerase IA-like protein
VTLRSGRFGPYVQLGEAVNGEKPKRAGLPRGTEPGSVDLDMALKLLSLPREVGRHPEDGEPILAGIGRFGAYVQHGKTYANVETGDDVLHIGLNRAVTLIAEKIAKGPRGRRFGGDPGRALGDHPDKSGPVVVKPGRYGPCHRRQRDARAGAGVITLRGGPAWRRASRSATAADPAHRPGAARRRSPAPRWRRWRSPRRKR